MIKNYVGEIIDLTGDRYLNPEPAIYDNGPHVRNVNQITSLSIHHDAVPRPHEYDSVARYKQEAAAHYTRLGPGLQYHYRIDNVGQIFKIRPHERWLYAVGSQENVSTLVICVDGYFHPTYNQKPTREQYEALSQLVINLCSEHPEFPATYPDVRPHSDFSSTACCGDTLRPYVLQITNEGTARNIPADAVYDWPELQEPVHIPAPPPPAPIPPAITYDDIVPARYVAQVNTHLDDVATGVRIADFAPGWQVDMVRRMRKGDQTWLQTAYSVLKTPTRGVPEKDLIIKNDGIPAPPSDPGTVPTPPVPTTPPSPSLPSHEDRIGALEALVAKIVAFLKSILAGLNKRYIMAKKVKRDSDPANDYSDGYNSGRRYWMRLLKMFLSKYEIKPKKGKK